MLEPYASGFASPCEAHCSFIPSVFRRKGGMKSPLQRQYAPRPSASDTLRPPSAQRTCGLVIDDSHFLKGFAARSVMRGDHLDVECKGTLTMQFGTRAHARTLAGSHRRYGAAKHITHTHTRTYYPHAYACTDTHTHTHTHARARTCYAHACACMHARTHIHTHGHMMYTHACYSCTGTRNFTCKCMRVQAHARIHRLLRERLHLVRLMCNFTGEEGEDVATLPRSSK